MFPFHWEPERVGPKTLPWGRGGVAVRLLPFLVIEPGLAVGRVLRGVRYAGSSYEEPILYFNTPLRKDVCLTFAVLFFVRFSISVANSGLTPPDTIQ